jgi:hypothetical protein
LNIIQRALVFCIQLSSYLSTVLMNVAYLFSSRAFIVIQKIGVAA